MRQPKRTLLEGTKQRHWSTYRLETDEERVALEQLKPSWGNRKHRRMFQEAVIAQLGLIDAIREVAENQPPKNIKVAESFDRRAKKVRNFVDRMKEPMPEKLTNGVARRVPSWPPPFGWSPFPERELLNYAEACERGATFFRRQHRHSADPKSAHIIKLLNFVRLHTEKAHLNDLAELLKRPCSDRGLNAARLDQLLRLHAKKSTVVRRETEQARQGITALVTVQAFGTLHQI